VRKPLLADTSPIARFPYKSEGERGIAFSQAQLLATRKSRETGHRHIVSHTGIFEQASAYLVKPLNPDGLENPEDARHTEGDA
jgi:hypothetical protein